MPRLRPEQLATDLKKGLAPIYIVSGEEPLLVQECSDAVRQTARANGFSERELYHADKSFDWNLLRQTSQNLSLFAERKIIEIRLDAKPEDAGRKALLDYAASPPEENLLLIISDKLDRKATAAKWFKTLEAASRFVQIWPLAPAQLPGWLKQRAQARGLDLSREAVELLAARVEGNLLAAVQELEKLALLSDNRQIDQEALARVVADSARYDIYGLVDKALAGDVTGASRALSGLRAEGSEVILVNWAIARELRGLLQISEAMDAGRPFAAAARQARIWERRQPLVKKAVERLRPGQFRLLLRKAAQMDRAAKGMDAGDPWDFALEILLKLAGRPALDRSSEILALRGQY